MIRLTLAFLFALSAFSAGMPNEHEHLRVRNTFKTPEEVVRYYLGRDASGFVWSGLLDVERKAFTTWDEPPEHDSFLIAKAYEILPKGSVQGNEANIEVRYILTGIGDAHGTRLPPSSAELYVKFKLKKVGGMWKIHTPSPPEISPVVLESKFRYATL